MALGTVLPQPVFHGWDNNGDPLVGGLLYTYAAGTTSDLATYSDVNLSVANTNPIVLDGAGRAVVFLTPGSSYKFLLKTSAGVTVWTQDNIFGVPTTDVTSLRNFAEGRLTATSGTAVTTADVSGATTIYYTPHLGTRIGLYDGSATWNVITFAELSISLAGLAASKPHDVFLYNNNGAIASAVVAWTSATARATALAKQDGIYVKSGATTQRYVGTVYINSTGGQTDDTAAKRYLSNYYNRVRRPLKRVETAASWTYTTATHRQANANTANQIEVMVGVAEGVLDLSLHVLMSNTTAGVVAMASIGEDSTTIPSPLGVGGIVVSQIANANIYMPAVTRIVTTPAVGRHFYAWLEYSTATGAASWLNDSIAADISGLTGWIDG